MYTRSLSTAFGRAAPAVHASASGRVTLGDGAGAQQREQGIRRSRTKSTSYRISAHVANSVQAGDLDGPQTRLHGAGRCLDRESQAGGHEGRGLGLRRDFVKRWTERVCVEPGVELDARLALGLNDQRAAAEVAGRDARGRREGIIGAHHRNEAFTPQRPDLEAVEVGADGPGDRVYTYPLRAKTA